MASVQSMTGFARARTQRETVSATVEIKSVNGKGLDIRLRYPPGMDFLDVPLRQAMQKRFMRGSLQVNLTVDTQGPAAPVRINEELLAHVMTLTSELVTRHNATPPSADGLLAIRGVVETFESDLDDLMRETILEAALDAAVSAIDGLEAARQVEGEAIRGILRQRMDEIEALARRAETDENRQPAVIRARLAQQVATLLDAGPGLDPARLHAEAALLAAKADIKEELDRLDAHVAAARKLLGEGGAIGRKLDFLAQEFNRESNTLCSKSNAVSITAVGLELKVVTDQFREQVQNLE